MEDPTSIISLVVNADDFGQSPDVCNGILRAHGDGILTSTSVRGNCQNPGAIADLLSTAPGLGVGAQLTLIGGRPVGDADQLRALLTTDGLFPAHARELYLRWAKGTLASDEIEREFDAQVTRLLAAGLRLDHLNTHRHLNFIPPIGRALETIARRHRIAGIRMAAEKPHLGWLTDAPRGALALAQGALAWMTRRQVGALRHGPQTWGYFESGRLDDIRILEILGRMGPGAHELVCHPGATDDENTRCLELSALTSGIVRQAIVGRNIRLCRWQDLF